MGGGNLFHRFYFIRAVFSKLFQILGLDELSQGQLPWLIFSVCVFRETLRAQSKFSGHLDMGIREPKLFSGVDPRMKFMGNAGLFCHVAKISLLVSRMRTQSKGVQLLLQTQ